MRFDRLKGGRGSDLHDDQGPDPNPPVGAYGASGVHQMYFMEDPANSLRAQMESMSLSDQSGAGRRGVGGFPRGQAKNVHPGNPGRGRDPRDRLDPDGDPAGALQFPLPAYQHAHPYYHRMHSAYPPPYGNMPYGYPPRGVPQAQVPYLRQQAGYPPAGFSEQGYPQVGAQNMPVPSRSLQHMYALHYQQMLSAAAGGADPESSPGMGWNAYGMKHQQEKGDSYLFGAGRDADYADSHDRSSPYYATQPTSAPPKRGKRGGADPGRSDPGSGGMKSKYGREGRRGYYHGDGPGSGGRAGYSQDAVGGGKGDKPAMNPHCSALLEEFRNNKNRKFGLQDIKGCVVEFSRDQYGSRFIQQKLEEATSEESDLIFGEIHPHAFRLMVDVFGNYVIQKFFEHGTHRQVELLGQALAGHVLYLSLQIYGCRVIQKALEVIDMEQKRTVVSELMGNVMKCVKDQNGNHVIQKCIECVPPELIHFIVEDFTGKVCSLASHPYGCRVIQRILEHCVDSSMQTPILEELLGSTVSLVQDQYGNYVIQHILINGRPEQKLTIVQKLQGSYLKLSRNKFGSNVVEKCVQYSENEHRDMIIREIVGTTQDSSPLLNMMKDQYGNYVIQKVLDHVDEERRMFIISLIKQYMTQMRKYTYSKHIIARVEKEERKVAANSGRPVGDLDPISLTGGRGTRVSNA
mmetsp:Transcript_13139/g.37289  ORF Transcript_13139/g.37289 Transcript_13139/m.37289 type:complete len:688 (+) Transcript_13139:582-2645(+)